LSWSRALFTGLARGRKKEVAHYSSLSRRCMVRFGGVANRAETGPGAVVESVFAETFCKQVQDGVQRVLLVRAFQPQLQLAALRRGQQHQRQDAFAIHGPVTIAQLDTAFERGSRGHQLGGGAGMES